MPSITMVPTGLSSSRRSACWSRILPSTPSATATIPRRLPKPNRTFPSRCGTRGRRASCGPVSPPGWNVDAFCMIRLNPMRALRRLNANGNKLPSATTRASSATRCYRKELQRHLPRLVDPNERYNKFMYALLPDVRSLALAMGYAEEDLSATEVGQIEQAELTLPGRQGAIRRSRSSGNPRKRRRRA